MVWVRKHLFGLPTPGAVEVFPQLHGLSHFRRAEMAEALIAERQGAWQDVRPRPGAVAVFRQYERRSHVGVMIDKRRFLHARHGLGTGVEALSDDPWKRRLVGVYDAL